MAATRGIGGGSDGGGLAASNEVIGGSSVTGAAAIESAKVAAKEADKDGAKAQFDGKSSMEFSLATC